MGKLISTTKQREYVENCHPGVGFLVYNNGIGVTEVTVFIRPKDKQLCYCSTGKPVEYEVYEEAR